MASFSILTRTLLVVTAIFILNACSATDQRNFVQALQTNKPDKATTEKTRPSLKVRTPASHRSRLPERQSSHDRGGWRPAAP